jgi:hypothetical protein
MSLLIIGKLTTVLLGGDVPLGAPPGPMRAQDEDLRCPRMGKVLSARCRLRRAGSHSESGRR